VDASPCPLDDEGATVARSGGARWAVRGLATLVVLALVLLGGAGWYYSDQLLPTVGWEPPALDLDVTAVGDGTVALARTDDAATWVDVDTPGVFGLRYRAGYARVGEVDATSDGATTRELEVLVGEPPSTDEAATTETYAVPSDVGQAVTATGVPFEEVTLDCPAGTCPAWVAPGTDDTWAIAVHGRTGSLAEGVRVLAVAHGLGMPVLSASHRGDGFATEADDGLNRFGYAEWEDVEAAVAYALDNGAADVVLVGHSQGGAVTAQLLRRSDLADRVVAVVWDSPLLAWLPTLRVQAAARGVPDAAMTPLLSATGVVSRLRAGLPFGELDQVDAADAFDVPVLLFHGTADSSVPVARSDAFAAARPDITTYVRLDGVEHVRSWNADPAAYEAAVEAHLAPWVDARTAP
jgi:uncharacterized protein